MVCQMKADKIMEALIADRGPTLGTPCRGLHVQVGVAIDCV